MNYRNPAVHFLLLIFGLVVLFIAAEKCRELVGREASSKSGEFSLFDCFDFASGTVACAAKEGVKFYTNNIRASIVETARSKAFAAALEESIRHGLPPQDATKKAEAAGKEATKITSKKTKRITGPIISAGWDFFEAIYYGGTITEASMRGLGTLGGTWIGGLRAEKRLGRVGYFIGSHFGSWLGGRVGLMVYDICNGIHYLVTYTSSFIDPDTSSFITTEDPDSRQDL